MSDSLEKIGAHEVAAWLRRHPGFLKQFPDLALTLVVSGGIGNLIDRVAQSYVVDFIRFAFWDRFPTFNVADISITVGVALLVIYILFIDGKKEKKRGTS